MPSLNPQKAAPAGIFGDSNGTVVAEEYCYWTQPRVNITVPALHLKLVDDGGAEWEQYWSIGSDVTAFVPSLDGKTPSPAQAGPMLVGTRQFPGNCNLVQLTTSLINSGFPANKMDEVDETADCRIFHGLYAFWRLQKNEAAERARARNPQPSQGESQREPVILVVSKIHKMPWENTGAGAVPVAGRTAATPPIVTPPPVQAPASVQAPTPAAPVVNGTLESLAQGIVLQAVAASGGGLDKMGLNGYIVNNPQLYGNDPTQLVPLINLVSQDAFLATVPGVKVEGGRIVAG